MAKPSIISIVAAGTDVNDPTPKAWTLNSPVPGDDKTRIERIFLVDGAIEVFASPLQDTELAKMNLRLQFILPMTQVKLIATVAATTDWLQMIKEAEEASEYDEEDDDEEEEDEEPVAAHPPTLTPQPTNNNNPPLPTFIPPGSTPIQS